MKGHVAAPSLSKKARGGFQPGMQRDAEFEEEDQKN